jgi:hypothetical protein
MCAKENLMPRPAKISWGGLFLLLLAGFRFENLQVPVEEILPGGPTAASIPVIATPVFVSPDAARYLADGDRVVGIRRGREARAYPIRILNYHQVVMDRLGDTRLAVTYCPLTRAVQVFIASVAGQKITLGVSGRLYKSNTLLFDHQTRSLWIQMLGKAVSGPMAGRRLVTHPAATTSWARWRERFPATRVLSNQTGFDRDYHVDPYAAYHRTAAVWFPVGAVRPELDPKTTVLGIASGPHARAYILDGMAGTAQTIHDDIDGHQIVIKISGDGYVDSLAVPDGIPLLYATGYWFAWQAFYPHTRIVP